MDISKYTEKKEKGLVEIITLGNAFALVSKRFDHDTGAELDPEIITINKDELVKQREQLATQLKSIDALLTDIKNPPTE